MTVTPFSALAALAGLSLREVSEYHDVPLNTVNSWATGRRRCPDGVIKELKSLIAAQVRTAAEALDQIRVMSATHGAPDMMEIGYPSDDQEARAMGWPCVGAWRAMAARVIFASSVKIALVPRGSTSATAAAADAQERRL